ncbi:MAG: ABC transporter substrate-binding protein [Bacillota bacterium]
MELEPVLAERWEFITDTTVRFYLKRGVTFHDGTPFNAEAVKFNFDFAIYGTPRARWAGLVGPVDQAVVVDAHTIDISMKEPYGPTLYALAMPYWGVLSPASIAKYGNDYGRNPVGTGPFKFVEWRTNDRIVLERNDEYWGDKPYLDRVVFRVIPEESARMMALERGEVQMVLQPAPSAIASLSNDPRFVVHQELGLRIYYLGFNCSLEPVNDPVVRRAVAHAINIPEIVEHVLEGGAVPAQGFMSPGVFGFHDMDLETSLKYDPALAQSLLAQAGWTTKDSEGYLTKDGKRLTLTMLGYRGRFLKDAEIMEAVQHYLRRAGIEVKIDWLEWAAAFEIMRSAHMPQHLVVSGWLTVNADADYSLFGLFHSQETPPKGWNRFQYANSDFDRLIEAGRATLVLSERLRLYRQAQEVLVKDVPMIPLSNTLETVITINKIKGFVLHPVEYNLILKGVWID